MRRGTINDCSFLDKEGKMVVEQGPGIFLRGRLTGGWGMFTASDYLCLHVIESGNGREIKTEEGVYQLGDISEEYAEFIEATQKGLRIITNWNMYGNEERGYYLTGDISQEKKALGIGKILAQKGNRLIIRRLRKEYANSYYWEDPMEVFVCWNHMSHQVIQAIKQGKVADLKTESFADFNGFHNCKPTLYITQNK